MNQVLQQFSPNTISNLILVFLEWDRKAPNYDGNYEHSLHAHIQIFGFKT
jgi:hypothetical protein